MLTLADLVQRLVQVLEDVKLVVGGVWAGRLDLGGRPPRSLTDPDLWEPRAGNRPG
jgi:hypothetical protein